MAEYGTAGPAFGIGGAAAGAGRSKSPRDAQALSFNQRVMSWYGIIAFLLLWQIAPWIGLANGQFIPPLHVIVLDAVKLVANGELFVHAASSCQRVLIGLFLALVVAILLYCRCPMYRNYGGPRRNTCPAVLYK